MLITTHLTTAEGNMTHMVSCSLLLGGSGLNLIQTEVVGGDTSIVLVLKPDNNWVQDAALQTASSSRKAAMDQPLNHAPLLPGLPGPTQAPTSTWC